MSLKTLSDVALYTDKKEEKNSSYMRKFRCAKSYIRKGSLYIRKCANI